MAYDYNKYMKDYRKRNLTTITVVFNSEKDEEVIKYIGTENKSSRIKELIKKGIAYEERGSDSK